MWGQRRHWGQGWHGANGDAGDNVGWMGTLGGDRSDMRCWGQCGADGDTSRGQGDMAADIPMSTVTWWPVPPCPSGAQVHGGQQHVSQARRSTVMWWMMSLCPQVLTSLGTW